MKFVVTLFSVFLAGSVFASAKTIDSVLVKKSERTLQLLSEGTVIKKYDISLGANPVGRKQQEGDGKTPEGKYILDYKKENSSFFRAIHISYPNEQDKERAKRAHVDPGGFIMIHGQKNGFGWFARIVQEFDWTDGCIAVTNSEMEEIWTLVKVGTPIEIRP